MDWFYDLPVQVSLPLFVVLFVLVSTLILVGLRPWVRRMAENPGEWDRVLGYAISSYGLFYGILLALVAVSVYQNFTEVHGAVLGETSALAALYRDVSGFPHADAVPLQTGLRDYVHTVITHDWPLQQQGIVPNDGTVAVDAFQRRLLAIEPKTAGQQALLTQTIGAFNDFVVARRARVDDTTLSLPSLLWGVLWVGAAINAVMLSLIQVKKLTIHLVMSGLIALYVGLLIYVTASMDHPYSGGISIGPDAFRLLLTQVMNR
jgi:Protein of unknown function (DUF4239)